MKLSSYTLGLVLVAVSTVLLSTAGLMTRLITMDTATILFWRGVWGGGAVALLMLVRSPRRTVLDFRRLGLPGWAIVVVTTASMSLFIAALHRTSVAHVAIIFATAPLIAAALGFLFLREKPGAGAIVASFAALAGVGLMVGTGEGGGLLGDALALMMTLCIVVNTLLARRYPDMPMLAIATLSALLGSLLAAPFATPFSWPVQEIWVVALFGIFGFAAGLALMLIGARLLPPVETSLVGALDAPLAPFWVWLVFGELLDRMTLIGGGLVMAAVCLHVLADFGGRRRAASAAAECSGINP